MQTNSSADLDIQQQQRNRMQRWYVQFKVVARVHQHRATMFLRHARYLNVFLVTLNAVVTSAVFSSIIDSAASTPLRIAAGCLSLIAAVCAALKAELNYDRLHVDHRNAFRGFEKIKHRVETMREIRGLSPVLTSTEDNRLNAEWQKLMDDWEALEADAPQVPADCYEKFKKIQDERDKEDLLSSSVCMTVSTSLNSPSPKSSPSAWVNGKMWRTASAEVLTFDDGPVDAKEDHIADGAANALGPLLEVAPLNYGAHMSCASDGRAVSPSVPRAFS